MTRTFAPYPYSPAVYEAEVPPLADGVDRVRHRVAIVGAGPVGLTAAIGLALQGVHSVLIEADDGVCAGSRAICISRRSLEIAQRLGALDGFLQIGLPWTGGRSYYRDAEVLHFSMPTDREPEAAADGEPGAVPHRGDLAATRRGLGRVHRHPLADARDGDRHVRRKAASACR